MKNYSVKKYQKSDYLAWNTFIGQAKNATFLFHRDFMEYHKDRFDDFSLIIFDEEKIVAVLPANRVGDTVYSHQGLTYGGLVYSQKLKLAAVLEVFKSVLFFLNGKKIQSLQLKMIPSIYHLKPADEVLYALFLADAKLLRRDSLSVIELSQKSDFSKIRKRGIEKGIANALLIKEEDDFELFWNEILIPNLEKRHNVKPVHTLAEIRLLKSHFPTTIRQFNVYFENKIVAGTTIFESENVAHCQYIAKKGSDENLGSLDFLYDYFINDVFATKKFFDFGISNENQGQNLNHGLCYWKESFGANAVVQDFYEVSTANFHRLENVLL